MSAVREVTRTNKRFVAHDNLIYLAIERQAGTIAKSALEAVMNSIDAGATDIDITVDSLSLVIRDNGRGFQAEQEIDEWFRVFGQPHALDGDGYSQDAKYGTFRIGRGQLFAFGVNTWTTNRWRLEVNCRERGLDFDQIELETPFPGCEVRVQFYELLGAWDQQHTIDEIRKYCRYVDCKLTVNGAQVNTPPAQVNWDESNELAWVKFSDSQYSGIDVYQLGVYVENIPTSVYGCSGTVVTKQQVKLNLARNQVLRNCPRWKDICKMLRSKTTDRIKYKSELNDSERVSVLSRLFAGGEEIEGIMGMGLLADVSGRTWTLAQLKTQCSANNGNRKFELTPDSLLRVTFAERGNSLGDKAMQQFRGLVFDRALPDAVNVAPEEFFRLLENKVDANSGRSPNLRLQYVSLETLLQTTNLSDYRLVDPRNETTTEKRIVAVCENGLWDLYRYLGISWQKKNRRIRIGESNIADGWTDGHSYIAISRRFLAGLDPQTESGWNAIGLLLAHEMCHSWDSAQSHVHGLAFYEAYHNLTRWMPRWSRSAYLTWVQRLKLEGKKIPKKLMAEIMKEEHAHAQWSVLEQAETAMKAEKAAKKPTKKKKS